MIKYHKQNSTWGEEVNGYRYICHIPLTKELRKEYTNLPDGITITHDWIDLKILEDYEIEEEIGYFLERYK